MPKAMRSWPIAGMPANPAGWLFNVARNEAIDVLRRDARLVHLPDDEALLPAAPGKAESGFSNELSDDEMALLFTVCHPALPVQSQIALALKALCGFGAREIAAGLLTSENNVAQRLARARKTIAEENLRMEVPPPDALPARRQAVLAALNLMFNEGYQSSMPDTFQRPDVCTEAIRLARAVALHPAAGDADAHALAATLLLHAARMSGRLSGKGDIVLLEDQPRDCWDKPMIALGLKHLQASQAASRLSSWHLQAGIAAEHAVAACWADTDWPLILEYYEALLRLDRSPMVLLGRAVALAQLHGPAAGLAALDAEPDELLRQHFPYAHVARAKWNAQLENHALAATNFADALANARNDFERRFIARLQAEAAE
jgi:RNA polymerase sigma-70 factor, ECF subfamily